MECQSVSQMSKLQTETNDPFSLLHNHKQEIWPDDPSNYFYNYYKWFKVRYINLRDIYEDIHFDSRNNLANSTFNAPE